jgi:hypothetical protein
MRPVQAIITNTYVAFRPRNMCRPVVVNGEVHRGTSGSGNRGAAWPRSNHLGNHEGDVVVPGRDRNRDIHAILEPRPILTAGNLVSQHRSRVGWREPSAMLLEK